MTNRARPPRRSTAGAAPRGGRVRIIGGRWRGTVLDVVDVAGLRPTPDRVRETLFNWLAHAFGGDLSGRTVLDLFAGSGALGFEAASRGAERVVMIEHAPAAARQLRQARLRLHAEDSIEIRQHDALTAVASLRDDGHRFDLIFLDPPFGQGRLDEALPLAAALLGASGLVYVEAEKKLDRSVLEALDCALYREDSAGEVFYHLLQRNKKEE